MKHEQTFFLYACSEFVSLKPRYQYFTDYKNYTKNGIVIDFL